MGPKENFKNPERKTREFGTAGKKIKYMIIGDSTAAGQGADYEKGIAVLTSEHLAKSYSVEMVNTSISGVQIEDVITDQLPVVEKYKPDITLATVGANNVIHLTPPWIIENQLNKLIHRLQEINPQMKIIFTASPEMGAIPRFMQPLRWFAGLYTTIVNNVFYSVIEKNNLILAPIAQKTGPLFKKDESLFAQDKFHPNEKGYATWMPILNESLNKAMNS